MPLSASTSPGVVLVFGLEPATVTWLTRQLRDADRPAMALRIRADLPPESAHAIVSAADAGIHVVSATRGMDSTFGEYWNLLAEAGKARFVAVHDLTPAALDINGVAAIASRVLDEDVLPTTMPLLDDDEAVTGVLDVITGRQWFPDGTQQERRADFDEAVELETNSLLEAAATTGEPPELAISTGALAPAVTVDVGSRAGIGWLSRHLPERQVPVATTVMPGDDDQPLLAAGPDGIGLGPVLAVHGDSSRTVRVNTLVDPLGMKMLERLEPGQVASARIDPATAPGSYLVHLD